MWRTKRTRKRNTRKMMISRRLRREQEGARKNVRTEGSGRESDREYRVEERMKTQFKTE